MKGIYLTAVQWFQAQVEQESGILTKGLVLSLIEQALQMEKEQHADTWLDSRLEDKGDNYIGKEKSFEQYYNETYNHDNTSLHRT